MIHVYVYRGRQRRAGLWLRSRYPLVLHTYPSHKEKDTGATLYAADTHCGVTHLSLSQGEWYWGYAPKVPESCVGNPPAPLTHKRTGERHTEYLAWCCRTWHIWSAPTEEPPIPADQAPSKQCCASLLLTVTLKSISRIQQTEEWVHWWKRRFRLDRKNRPHRELYPSLAKTTTWRLDCNCHHQNCKAQLEEYSTNQ